MFRYGALVPICLAFACPSLWAQDTALSATQKTRLVEYARDTWKSMDAMNVRGGLPTDHLTKTEAGWEPSSYTSPTNIAAYLWSTIAAERLGFLSHEQASAELLATVESVQNLERYQGFFYNWYDSRTQSKLRVWPDGVAIKPFLSSVDNGWLAAALHITARVHPEVSPSAGTILSGMNFAFFYDAYDAGNPESHPGLLRGGYFPEQNRFTGFHYGLLNTEPRIVSYLGLASGQLPTEHYALMRRGPEVSMFAASSSSKPLQKPLPVLPSWDGTMFEALMVALFVPEASWAPQSWGLNHPRYVHTQIEYGMSEAKLGYWGISASSNPHGGYAAYGVKRLSCAPRKRKQERVITPHASFLAMPFAPQEAMRNLENLCRNFPIYSEFGFLDSVDVVEGRVSSQVLSLDQGMILAAIVNMLDNNLLQTAFSEGQIERHVRPLMEAEHFFASKTVEEITERTPARPPVTSPPAAQVVRFDPPYAILSSPTRRNELRRGVKKS